MRKSLLIIVAIITLLAFTLAGCGDKASDDGGGATDSSGSYKIGVNTWGSGVPILDNFGDVSVYSAEALGNETVRASDDFTADKELTNAQNFASQGVDGVVFQLAAPPVLPEVGKVFADAKIPFVFSVFIGDDADLEKELASNEYIVGAIDSDMVFDGELIGQQALDDGVKTACIIGGNIGDNNMDQRIAGFKKVFEAGGGKVLAEARCTDASEAATKAEDMLSSNKDVDALYALVGDYIPGSMSAIDNLQLGDLLVYVSCTDAATAELIKEGRIKRGNDGINLAAFITPTLLQNWLDGNKILDDSGKAPHFRTIPFAVTADNVEDYLNTFYAPDGSQPLAESLLKSLIVKDNPDVTYQTYVDFIQNGLTLEKIMEAKNAG
ncbi:MAG: substrate-binding domain-containing protein [Clostridiales Family XIII bacterium]|jgi:ABC-type sugar transport system substrate-binding protein|nr:substrate-binding domain-containing protein [Clostridiales Family XIII bacterium]